MQAALYDSFNGPISIKTISIPSTPDDGVLLQVMATGVCRSDWHGWKGHDSDIVEHGLPFCPGHEVSGIVAQVGKDCFEFQIGDRVAVPFILSCGSCVYCRQNKTTICSHQKQPGFTQYGSFAEYVALPRADLNLKRLPDNVSFIQAAALGCRFTTAYRAVVQQGGLRMTTTANSSATDTSSTTTDSTICIFGAGGLGLSCVMIAAALKTTKIIAVDISRDALAKALELGATHTVMADENVVPTILELTTEQQGSPLTIDAAGFASTCEAAIHCTRRGGRMIQVGLPVDTSHLPQFPMGLVASRELELIGSHGASADTVQELLILVANGTLDPSRIVERQVSLKEGVRVLQNMDKASPLGMTMITSFARDDSRL
jgi:alcohol dehydrogenase